MHEEQMKDLANNLQGHVLGVLEAAAITTKEETAVIARAVRMAFLRASFAAYRDRNRYPMSAVHNRSF